MSLITYTSHERATRGPRQRKLPTAAATKRDCKLKTRPAGNSCICSRQRRLRCRHQHQHQQQTSLIDQRQVIEARGDEARRRRPAAP